MDKRLKIKKGEALIQIDGNVYKIPRNLNLVEKYKNNSNVMERTRELAREYGTNFINFHEGINCIECNHTNLFSVAAQEGSAIHNGGGPGPCSYEENTEEVNVFNRKEKGLFGKNYIFMAKDLPCTIKDAYRRALMEKGYLDEFLIEGVVPREFPPISEFEIGGELEKTASREYALCI